MNSTVTAGLKPTHQQRLELRKEPLGSPIMLQDWKDLLFVHWEWDPAEIQRTLPDGLFVDTFKDKAYLGIVPFKVEGARAQGMPVIPALSNFLELNVRTYVHDAAGCPGIWFYSLECNSWIAVRAARRLFSLPYEYSSLGMELDPRGDATPVSYTAKRSGRKSEFVYTRLALAGEAAPESLEFFLVERYALYTASVTGQLFRLRLHHQPYPLRGVGGLKCTEELLELNGFSPPTGGACHAIASTGVHVRIFPMEEVIPKVAISVC